MRPKCEAQAYRACCIRSGEYRLHWTLEARHYYLVFDEDWDNNDPFPTGKTITCYKPINKSHQIRRAQYWKLININRLLWSKLRVKNFLFILHPSEIYSLFKSWLNRLLCLSFDLSKLTAKFIPNKVNRVNYLSHTANLSTDATIMTTNTFTFALKKDQNTPWSIGYRLPFIVLCAIHNNRIVLGSEHVHVCEEVGHKEEVTTEIVVIRDKTPIPMNDNHSVLLLSLRAN